MFNTPTIAVAATGPFTDGSSALAVGAAAPTDAGRLTVVDGRGQGSTVSWWAAALLGVVVFLTVVAAARLVDAGEVEVGTPPVAVVVQPGDSVWTVVRSVVPDGDVRSIVAQINTEREGRLLQPGDVIWVPVGS